jgi:heme/copper-type cytochrome/quinol oxidase subunit 1
LVLLAAGAGTWRFVPENEAAQFGWFAYAPLSDELFTPPPLLVASTGQRWALAVAALGAVLISVAAGYRIGRPDSLEPVPGRPA